MELVCHAEQGQDAWYYSPEQKAFVRMDKGIEQVLETVRLSSINPNGQYRTNTARKMAAYARRVK